MIRVATNHERDIVRPAPPNDARPAASLRAASSGEFDGTRDHGFVNRELRRLAAAFESAQARRLRTGEAILRLARERAPGAPGKPEPMDPGVLLARVRAGSATGPEAALAAAYRQHWNEERELLRLVSEQLARHPAWHWLGRVRGVGPSLGARLLARLDIDRAPTPSSFWSYCGLATVTATVYRCVECGYELSLPAGRALRASHRVPETSAQCRGSLAQAGESPHRVAQPRPARGGSATYDREAKTLCYLIGTSLVREGDAYQRYYHTQRARLDAAKSDWIPRRRHLTALRMTEKLFLAHLWLVWRERLGLPITAPYAEARDDAVPAPRPWSMVGT